MNGPGSGEAVPPGGFQVRALLFVLPDNHDLEPGPVPIPEGKVCFPIDAEPLLSGREGVLSGRTLVSNPQAGDAFALRSLRGAGGWLSIISHWDIDALALHHPEAVSRRCEVRRFDDVYVWMDARDALAWLVEHRPHVVVEALLEDPGRARLTAHTFDAAAVAEVFRVTLPGPADYDCPWREGGSWTVARPGEDPVRRAYFEEKARRMPAWFPPQAGEPGPGPLGGVRTQEGALEHLWATARARHNIASGRPTRPMPPD